MEDYKVALYFLLGSIIIGAIIYGIVRVLFNKKIQESNSAAVTKWGYVQAIVVVLALLVLFWFVQADHKSAAVALAVIMVTGKLYANYYLNKHNQSK